MYEIETHFPYINEGCKKYKTETNFHYIKECKKYKTEISLSRIVCITKSYFIQKSIYRNRKQFQHMRDENSN